MMVNFDRGMQIPAQVGGPDLSPENMSVSDYSGEFEAKVSQLEQQIAQVKERIARNERALTGKSFEDTNNGLAALEMKKINSADPTMLWRWNQQRQDTNTANARISTDEHRKYANTVDMWLGLEPASSSTGIDQQIFSIREVIRDGKNINANPELKRLLEQKIDELKAAKSGGGTAEEKIKKDVDILLGGESTTSAEVEKFLNEHPDLESGLKAKLTNRLDSLKNKESNDKNQAVRTNVKNAISTELTNKNASLLKSLIDEYKTWTTAQMNTLLKWIKSQQRISATAMKDEIKKIQGAK